MTFARRAVYGALGGAGGTLVLTGFRKTLARAGLVHETAPQQVVLRLEELGLLEGVSSRARDVLTVTAHLAYGIGTGAAFGGLRRENGALVEDIAVGSALGILAWGAAWSSWLPLAGVHLPPWRQQTPKVLLPVLDHAVFGGAWAMIYRRLCHESG